MVVQVDDALLFEWYVCVCVCVCEKKNGCLMQKD